MKLFNLRYGLATNSSSSHSLIFMKGVTDNDVYGADFGWDRFRAASRDAKIDYVRLILNEALAVRGVSAYAAEAITRQWMELDRDTDWQDGYIDHQSMISLPSTFGNAKEVDRQFFDDFKAFMLRDDLVVLGGNDNESLDWKPEGDFNLPFTDVGHNFTCRKDGNYWTLFNRDSGFKIRFAFDDLVTEPTKASAPELVDVKITDFCPYDCPYCYMGSTVGGVHADEIYLDDLAHVLASQRVFEVAIGGGEPTLHTGFWTFVENLYTRGIVPNFTTRNLAWMRNPRERDVFVKCVGAFAFSLDNVKVLERLDAALVEYAIPKEKCNIHLTMGAVSMRVFEDLLREIDKRKLRVTLLGYKTNGRGSTFKPENYSTWLEVVKKLEEKYECPTLSIDTVLAAEYDQALQDSGIPKYLYHIVDGKFSAYVDAVNKKIGPYSYCDESKLVDLNLDNPFADATVNEFKRIFATF